MLESRWLDCKRPEAMLRFLEDKASPRKLRLFVCACCRRLWPWLRIDASRQAVEELERQADTARVLTPTKTARELARCGSQVAAERRQASLAAEQEAQTRRATAWGSIWVGDPPDPSFLVRSAAEAEEALANEEEASATVRAADLVVSIAEEQRDSRLAAEEAVHVVSYGRLSAATRARAARWTHRADEEEGRPVPRSKASLRASQAAHWIEQQEEAARDRAERQDERAAKGERRAQCALIRDLFGNPFRVTTIEPDWLVWNEGCAVKMARTIYDERKYQDMIILADALEEAGCDVPAILDHCRQASEHARGCWVLDLLLGLTRGSGMG
jgi:hypothetical protein